MSNLDQNIQEAKAQLDAHTVEIVNWHFSPDTGVLMHSPSALHESFVHGLLSSQVFSVLGFVTHSPSTQIDSRHAVWESHSLGCP